MNNKRNKKTRTMYMTSIAKGFWPYATPRPTRHESLESAENQICADLLSTRSIKYPRTNYGHWLRLRYPEVVEDAQQYIGETLEIEKPIDMTSKEYQKWFCQLDRLSPPDYNSGAAEELDAEEGSG